MTATADDPVREALERAIGFQYEIIGLLGRGGMGAVYHAHEKALDRPVAIKVLPPDAMGGDARERFLREARTAARLTHPNIVPLLTFGEAQGLVYYVMGYVEGESLEQRLRRAGRLDADTAAAILEQLAQALEYAHQQGIVHRDVKPDNVLIERATGIAKLTDFGIAKRAAAGETLTGTGLLMGTPRYMSPEQASGERDLDARSDVYSLALVGYAMLVGRPPFDGGSVQEVLTQQVTREAPSLRSQLPDLPSRVANTIDRGLRKRAEDRHQSAGAMAAALRTEDGEDEALSIARTMRKPGVWALTTMVVSVASLNLAWFFATRETPATILVAYFGLLPVSALADWAVVRWREKRSPDEIRRMLTEPPRWWPFWWPASWRRKDDVWVRLPVSLRRTRIVSSIGVFLFVFATELTYLALTASKNWLPERRNVVAIPIVLFYGGSLLALVAAVMAGWWWGRRNGLSPEETNRLVSAPTGRARFWGKPLAARFLRPLSESGDDPRTPRALAEAVAAIVPRLAEPQRAGVGAAAQAARQLAEAVEAIDVEMGTLARDADPAERERLERRLAALGASPDTDSPAQREMRQLYASQLDLLRRLSRQAAHLADRRARYAEMLRMLWLQLSTLRAEQADAARIEDISQRIQRIVESVEREVSGIREVEATLLPTGQSP